MTRRRIRSWFFVALTAVLLWTAVWSGGVPAASAAETGTITGAIVALDIYGRDARPTVSMYATRSDGGSIDVPVARDPVSGAINVQVPAGVYTEILFVNEYAQDEICIPRYLTYEARPDPNSLPLTVPADGSVRVDATFDPHVVYRLKGRVTDSGGHPVVGAGVTLDDSFVGHCADDTTGVDGSYEVHVNAGSGYVLGVFPVVATLPPQYFFPGGFDSRAEFSITTEAVQTKNVTVPTLDSLGLVRVRIRHVDGSRNPGQALRLERRVAEDWIPAHRSWATSYGNALLQAQPGAYRLRFPDDSLIERDRFSREVCQASAASVFTVRSGREVSIDERLSASKMCALANPTLSTLSPRVGTVLRISEPRWTATPRARSYRWYRDQAPIKGAVQANYTVTAADVGHRLYLREKANHATAGTGTTTSPTTQPVRR